MAGRVASVLAMPATPAKFVFLVALAFTSTPPEPEGTVPGTVAFWAQMSEVRRVVLPLLLGKVTIQHCTPADVSQALATRDYDELSGMFSRTGRFNSEALKVLSRSFVEMGALPSEPDVSKLITEQYLPSMK